MKKTLLLSMFLFMASLSAKAQCEYVNGDFENWDFVTLEIDDLSSDAWLPENHLSAIRLLLNLIYIDFGLPPFEEMFLNDPQLFLGLDRSTDASSGEYAIKIYSDTLQNFTDLLTAFPCDDIPDSIRIDLKHVGNAGIDTLYIYGAFDEGTPSLPADFSGVGLDTVPAILLDSLFFTSDSGYFTRTIPILVNDDMVQTDSFLLYFYATTSNNSYYLIDNIQFIKIVDEDMDGFTSDVDCDDNNPDVNPNATEVCNGIDDNCDGQIDEGVLSIFYVDSDMDGFGDPNNSTEACDQPPGTSTNGQDCDDSDPDEFPGQTWYKDEDGDGYGDGFSITNCERPMGFFLLGELIVEPTGNGKDCDDNNVSIYPGAVEICDNIDNDCNGMIDDNVTFQDYYFDGDMDGFGGGAPINDCQSPGVGYILVGGDCNDDNADVNPDAPEVCNGIDDNCDGQVDDGVLSTFYLDADNDGYGDLEFSVEDCAAPVGYVDNALDCDDSASLVNPDAPEVCNGIDDNCDGQIDEGVLSTFYLDADNDGYGDLEFQVEDCAAPAGYVGNALDCDDSASLVNPDAPEVCNGIDDNCDGQIDEGVLSTFYLDADNDGYGDLEFQVEDCAAPAGYVDNALDCDDSASLVNPDAPEVCNGIDDNCDGQIDEGLLTTFYADADMDGFGDPNNSTEECDLPPGFTTDNTDCDDTNSDIFPGATEIANNGIDEDCDGEDLISNVEDELAELNIRIYPNPFADHIFIENVPSEGFKIELINLLGQKIPFTLASNSSFIYSNNLPSGTYFVKITEINTNKQKVELLVKK